MTDLIVSSVYNFGWPQLRPYVVSLDRTGFRGTRLMFVEKITEEARENLLRYGFTLVPSDAVAQNADRLQLDPDHWVVCYRYGPVVEFLRHHFRDFRYVIWTDVRDLIFQTDPTLWLEDNLKPPYQLVAATVPILVEDCGMNDRWSALTNGSDHPWLRTKEVCCAGTIAGNSLTVSNALAMIHHITSVSPDANDQAAWQQFARMFYRAVTIFPRMKEAWCSTWYSYDSSILTDEAPTFRNGVFYAPETGVPFSMVHIYDRDPVWKNTVERRYR